MYRQLVSFERHHSYSLVYAEDISSQKILLILHKKTLFVNFPEDISSGV